MPLRVAVSLPSGLAALLLVACGGRSPLREPRPVHVDVVEVEVVDAIDAPDVPDVVEVADVRDIVDVFDCRHDHAACDDGNACTSDGCDALTGQCVHGGVTCTDGDPCTADTCEPTVGCVFPHIECGGCADGVREAFLDHTTHPDIAGCAGGFAFPGLAADASPMCGRAAGNNGPNPNGVGCSAADLCASGFHVCRSAGDVATHSPDGCDGASDAAAGSFFASRQTGPGCLQCATGTVPGCTNANCAGDCAPGPDVTNDIFGCGNTGSVPQASCAPLNRSGNNLCSALPSPWVCNAGANADVNESTVVTKDGPAAGGVLCCRD